MGRACLRLLFFGVVCFLAIPASAEEPSLDALEVEAAREVTRFEYRAAEKLLRRVLKRAPTHVGARLRLALVLQTVGEGVEAVALAEAARVAAPDSPEPYRLRGQLSLKAGAPDEAKAWFDKALARKANDLHSLLGLARAAIIGSDLQEANRQIARAEAVAPDAIAVWVTRAVLLQRMRATDQAAHRVARILARDPWNRFANGAMAGGTVLTGRPLYRPPWTPVPYDRKVKRAAKLYRARKFEEAGSAFLRLDTADAFDGRPAFYRGLVALRERKTRFAIRHLKRSVEQEPDNFLFRNALIRAIDLHIENQRIERGGGSDKLDRLGSLADRVYRVAPIPGVAQFVRGYDALLPREQQVILQAIHPFRRHVAELVKQGVTHDILGMDERIGAALSRSDLREGRTPDGRWIPAMRGKGGHNAATGLEFVVTAAQLGDNTFAHEFAHQVHLYALTAKQKVRIKDLYRDALAHGRALTAYARTDDLEYFAVAYEAFVSVVKSPWQVGALERTDLKARDPALYDFLLEVTNTPKADPGFLRLRAPIEAFYAWSGHKQKAAQVRTFFEDATR